jgi:hypothetical protein
MIYIYIFLIHFLIINILFPLLIFPVFFSIIQLLYLNNIVANLNNNGIEMNEIFIIIM